MDAQVLMQGAAQMPTTELERFIQELNVLLTRRRRTEIPYYRERYLLGLINQTVLSKEKTDRYKALIFKHEYETMTAEEEAELLQLTDEEEGIRAERLGYLAELAQLKNIPLQQLMENLGLIRHPHV
jgi:hypothetical protein